MIENKYVSCSCHSPEHLLIFMQDEEFDLIYLYVGLKKQNLFKRIFNAIFYIFGYQSKYGHFDEFIIDKNNSKEIIEILSKIENKKDQ